MSVSRMLWAALLSACLVAPASAQSSLRFVSTGGVDSGNDCTNPVQPCGTVARAVSQSAGGDTIKVSAGTFTEPFVLIDRDVTIQGQGVGQTILQSRETNPKNSAAGGLITNQSGVSCVVEDLTIRHSDDLIYNDGTLSIFDAEILDNTLNDCGCAVTNSGTGSLLLSGVRVSGNYGLGCGCGAVNNFGYLEIDRSEISENGCDWEGPDGGGVENHGEALITNTSIVRNDCQDGHGGGINNRGSMTLSGSTVGHNSTLHASNGGITNTGELEIINSTVTGNSARDGWVGAIGNSGSLSIVSSTVVGNSAEFTTGGISAGGTVNIKNSIIANNADSSGTTDCNGSISSYGFNIISNVAGCTVTEVENPGTDMLGTAPLVGHLDDNGGPTYTHSLLASSPAIDSGSCTDIAGQPIVFDQRGEPRNDGSCDIGAFELQPTDCRLAWSAGMTVTHGAEYKNLAIGQGSSTTQDIDGLCGESEVPPSPPPGTFDARLVFPDGTTAALTDYRSDSADPVTYRITFQPGMEGYGLRFDWNPSMLPPGTFVLKDAITGTVVNVDMKSQSSYYLSNGGISSLLIEHAAVQQRLVPVAPGWNLVSVPLETADMHVAALFPTATSGAFAFDYGYVQTDPLRTGEGFWLKFAAAETYTVEGQPAGLVDVPVAPGWNIIAPFDADVPTDAITSTPPGIVSAGYFGFSSGYQLVPTLSPGMGYWVKATEAGTLHLNGSAKDGQKNTPADLSRWGRLVFEDAAGGTGTLLIREDGDVAEYFEMPPVPPRGVFDVRFENNYYAAVLNPEAEVKISSVAYPVTLRAENLGNVSVRVRDAIDGTMVDDVVSEVSAVSIAHPVERLVLTAEGELPRDYALYQNYPNPFNPTSTIGFTLPEEADVRLALYDLLGREVQVLLNERTEAGSHTVSVDAGALASGVYLYRMEANGFAVTKRLTVLR